MIANQSYETIGAGERCHSVVLAGRDIPVARGRPFHAKHPIRETGGQLEFGPCIVEAAIAAVSLAGDRSYLFGAIARRTGGTCDAVQGREAGDGAACHRRGLSEELPATVGKHRRKLQLPIQRASAVPHYRR